MYGELDNPQFLHSPRHGPDVCVDCFNLTRGFRRCFACAQGESHLDAIAPISYSVGHGYLHHLLASYKRLRGARAEAAARQISAILTGFLIQHEHCVSAAAGVEQFDVVTTVPSSDSDRDALHPLRRVVAELVRPTHDRHERLLRRTQQPVKPRRFDPGRFAAVRPLDGVRVLLIDDTWTTGASAQSAASALREAGAASVAAVVVGRYVNREWLQNDQRVDGLAFDWNRCALCAAGSQMMQAA